LSNRARTARFRPAVLATGKRSGSAILGLIFADRHLWNADS
jgi:hypothetical protein